MECCEIEPRSSASARRLRQASARVRNRARGPGRVGRARRRQHLARRRRRARVVHLRDDVGRRPGAEPRIRRGRVLRPGGLRRRRRVRRGRPRGDGGGVRPVSGRGRLAVAQARRDGHADRGSRPGSECRKRTAASPASPTGTAPQGCCAPSTRSPCWPGDTCTSSARTRDHLANVALAVRARQPESQRGDVQPAPHPRRVHVTRAGSRNRSASSTTAWSPTARSPSSSPRQSGRQDGPHPPAYIHAYGQGFAGEDEVMTNYHSADPLRGPSWSCADVLWRQSEVGPADVDVAQFYDAFTPMVVLALEGYGFCGRGEGAAFTDDGRIAWPDGQAADQHVGWRAVGGLRPWLQPRSRRRPPSARDVDLPGRRRAVLVGDERRRCAHQRAAPEEVSMIELAYTPPVLLTSTAETVGFFEAARDGDAQCGAVHHVRTVPSPAPVVCPACRSFERHWQPVSGRGHIWSWIVVAPSVARRLRRARSLQRRHRRVGGGSQHPIRRQSRRGGRRAPNEIDPASIVDR